MLVIHYKLLLLLALKEYLHLIFPECINRDLPNKKIADLYKYMQQHSDSAYLKTDINGKATARIMFFNGLSQTPEGPISYLPNPYREENLAFSLKMQLKAEEYYPGFTRKIYLKGLRYNEHLRPRSALIEVGAQTNTFEEAKNAMEPLAELLDMVLQGN